MSFDLKGTQVQPSELTQHIGKQAQYLREKDIDKSGRGYYFPRTGEIQEVKRRQVCIDGDWITFTSLRQINIL